ncbi:MAG: MFS transporter [Candidatus Caldarchaeum sp.]
MTTLINTALKTFSYFVGLSKDVKLLITGQAFFMFQMGLMQLVLPIFFAETGMDGTQVGMIITAGQLTAAFLSLPLGMLADRYGRKKFVTSASLLAGASFLGYIVFTRFIHVLLDSIVLGLAISMFYAPFSAWMANVTLPERRNAVFSLSSAVNMIGVVAASLLAWLPPLLRTQLAFNELDSYKPVIAVAAIMPMFAAPVFALVKEDLVVDGKRSFLPRKSIHVISRISVVQALFALGAGLVIPLFPYWFYLRFKVDETVLAPLYAVANITLLFSFLLAPRLAESFGVVRTIVYSQTLATILLVLIPLAESYAVAGVLVVLRGLFMNMVNPLVTSLILGLTDPEERATSSGVMAITWSVPNAATPTVGGYLMQNVSLSLPFYLCGIFYSVAVFLFYVFFRGKNPHIWPAF